MQLLLLLIIFDVKLSENYSLQKCHRSSIISRGKRGFAAKRILLFTNVASPFNDHSLQIILDSLRRQDIIVDAIGPTWGQDDDEDGGGEEGNEPMTTTDGNDHTASARTTTNGHASSHSKQQKPLTQQQKTNIRLINRIVNQTEGTLFTFR